MRENRLHPCIFRKFSTFSSTSKSNTLLVFQYLSKPLLRVICKITNFNLIDSLIKYVIQHIFNTLREFGIIGHKQRYKKDETVAV